ncbi:MAG: DsbE family thiol:disulfide interchange protein [Pseudomonadota bacterium]
MSEETATRSNLLRFLPVVGFLVVAGAFYFGLNREDADILPSTFIDRPAPETALAPLLDSKPGLALGDLADGEVKLVNIWASWCGPCRVEHPFLMELAEDGVDIRGFNYKDTPEQAKAFLSALGDPYSAIGQDRTGRAGIEWGVYGVPETFVINGEGRIIYKHIGPVQARDLRERIRPAIEQARKSAGG